MKKSIFSLFALVIFTCANAFAVPSATIDYGTPTSATDAVWNTATQNNITYASVNSSQNFSANWKGYWDNNNLYLLITVTDNDYQSNTWNGDATEVYIRPTNGSAIQLATSADGTAYKNDTYFSVLVSQNATAGYIKYFYTIPKTNLYNFANKSLYLDIAVDYSNYGMATRESQYSWGEDPHSNMNNPTTTFGTVTLEASNKPTETNALSISALGSRTSIYELGDFACLVASITTDAQNDESIQYIWKKDGVQYTGKNYNNNNIRPTAAGVYTCEITYANGTKHSTSNAITITTTNNTDNYLRKQNAITNLPIIVIRTGDTQLPSWNSANHCGAGCTPANTKIPVDMKIVWNGEGAINSLADMSDNASVYYDRKARINYRGSTSRTMAKKNFALSTCKKNLTDNGEIEKGKVDMFGFPEGKDWVLYAAYQDKSMMRNKLAMEISRAMGYYASATKYVELYIDGEYWGVYVFMEKYERDENRINVTKEPEGNTDASKTGYVLKFDKVNLKDPGTWFRGDVTSIRSLNCLDGNCYQNAYKGCGSHGGCGDAAASTTKQGWEIVYPDPADFSGTNDYRLTYIKNFLTNMEIALYNAKTDADYEEVFEEFIDLQSFADFMLIEEFARNTDGYRASMWFSKDVDGKLKCVAPWDFEMGYGNSRTHGGSLTNIWQHMYAASESCNGLNYGDSEPYYPIPFWWEKLKRSTCFKNMLKTRWEMLRATILDKDILWNRVDSMVNVLQANGAITREMNRWSWATRNSCVTGCKTPAYNNCPWIIVPWDDSMTNSDGTKIHPMPTNMPKGFTWGDYTKDNNGKKTLTYNNEYMLMKGWLADRLIGIDNLISALGATTFNESGFKDCAQYPDLQFKISTTDNVTEICDNGEYYVTLTINDVVTGTHSLSYQWKKNGVDIIGATKDSIEVNEAAVYTCDVTINYLGGIPTLYQNYSAQVTITDKNCATIAENVNEDEEIISITAYDILGAEIGKYYSLDEMKENLPSGVNIVKVETTKNSFVKKLLVK